MRAFSSDPDKYFPGRIIAALANVVKDVMARRLRSDGGTVSSRILAVLVASRGDRASQRDWRDFGRLVEKFEGVFLNDVELLYFREFGRKRPPQWNV